MDDLHYRVKLALAEIDSVLVSLKNQKIDEVVIANVRRMKKAVEGILID